MKPKRLLAGVAFLAAMVSAGSAPAQLKELVEWTRSAVSEKSAKKTIAYFKLNGPLAETPVELPPLFGSEPRLSLHVLLERLKQARRDEDVVAIVVDLQNAMMGLAQLEEIHGALRKFSAVEKDVYVHADSLRTMTYTLATGASHISVVPTGDVWLTGLYSESPYLRGTLDKLKIVPDLEHCGDYKTAHEMFTRTGPSEESKAMTKWLLDGMYESLVALIATGRDQSPQRVAELIDNGPYTAEEALAAGLIDSVGHRQDFIAALESRYGDPLEIVTDYGEDGHQDLPEDIFAMFSFFMKLLNPSPKGYTEPTVAIIYVEGLIQTGSADFSPFGLSSGAYSTTIRKALDKAAEQPSVKAVVLRVDSPGGSALASEIIWDATQRVVDKKPLIVSMGNVAGSGGYYVACGADTIFADRTTITASIGVVGGKLVTTGGWEKLGVNWHAESRGRMAGMLSTAAPFTEEERAKFRHYMNTIYEVFKGRVVDGRKGRLTKPIDEIAGGRVFTGSQALELGLVDKIGGLQKAVRFAAGQAGISDYEIRVIPEPPTIFELFRGGRGDDEFALHALPAFRTLLSTLAKTDPQRMQAVFRLLQRLELIHKEGVVAVMPTEWVIR